MTLELVPKERIFFNKVTCNACLGFDFREIKGIQLIDFYFFYFSIMVLWDSGET